MTDTAKQLRVVNIELRCGCGAQTFIEWPMEAAYVNYLPDLVKGFHAAHAPCHRTPATKGTETP